MKPTLALRSFLLGSSILATATSLHAADRYWDGTSTTANADGGSGTWAAATTNWDTLATGGADTTFTTSTDSAVFVGAAGTVTLGAARTAAGLSFNTGGTVISASVANVLTIGAGGITVDASAGSTNQIGTGVAGTGNVALSASQQWTNNSAYTFFARDADVNLGANTLTLSGSGQIALASSTNGTGNIVVSSGATASMSGNNTYSGTTTINGILTINSLANSNVSSGLGNKASNVASNLVIDGGTLRVQVSSTTSDRLFTVGAGGATFEAINTAGNSGQILLSGSTAITYSGIGNRTITLGGASDDATGSSIARAINDVGGGNGTVALVKNGTHLWTVSGTNGYSGGTTVSAGTLTMGSASALGSTSGQLTVNTGGTLNMAANSLTVGNLTGTGGVISGTSGTRTLTIGQGDTGGGNYQGQINNGASGTTALTKTGTGTITLSGTNGYSGATSVNGGKLTISAGNINGTSGISIGAGEFNYNSSNALTKAVSFSGTGGTLSGSSTINLAVNVTTGNTLAIGNSVGVMNFGSNLTVGGTYLYELNNTDNTADLGDVTGNLTLGGILDLVQLGAYTTGDKFTLFAYDGILSGVFTGILDDTNFTDAGGLWTMNYNDTTAGLNGGVSATNKYVTITAIPEPRAALLGGLGMLMLLRRRRN